MYKVFSVCLLLAVVSAAPADHQATSYASFNDNHNSVHHIESAVAPIKYAAPAHYSQAPAHYSQAPVAHYSPAPVHYSQAPAHYSHAAPAHYSQAPAHYSVHAAPVVAKVAVPVAKVAAPVYHSSPVVHQYSAPTYSAVAKQVYAAPVAKYVAAPAYAHKEEEYAPAHYEYSYSIQDAHTGDFHSQEEKRDGDHVVGQYSLHEADGTVRIVKYFDEGHGFNAVVERQGKPTEAPVYKKVVAVAAPEYSQHY
ncbi:unnamed protein product [Ceutorhynchus assimilis]|uniref:Cuticle protein n=1 Tax=Ceutorhynchus assimilis TaxID=467358 RepID=A0A9N9MWV7_9CUCU|nr:unnamed protein product [Ceutorhynchus assimilis]